MHYDQYLARGLPIASGSVEGACKNLIKDRMERSGMRWTEAMAEAIVKLRAIYLSVDFEPGHDRGEAPLGRWRGRGWAATGAWKAIAHQSEDDQGLGQAQDFGVILLG